MADVVRCEQSTNISGYFLARLDWIIAAVYNSWPVEEAEELTPQSHPHSQERLLQRSPHDASFLHY